MNITKSILLNTDSYKISHQRQYPPHTTGIYSYIESRGGRYDRTLFFGLQAFIKEYLMTPITQQDIDFATKFYQAHGMPFEKDSWQYILDHHQGHLPVRIRAVPEGTIVPVKNVLVTIENTDPNCFWLTSWIETALLRAVWYPTTVATLSYHCKKIILNYLEKTGSPESIDFRLHDFGSRSASSFETAGLGGAAHLINFKGTDTVTGILAAMEYYGAGVCGHSIPASEHSSVTSWGRENEAAAYANMLKQFGQPGSILACVSDSFDIYHACEHLWGDQLRQQIIDSGATLVIRPDSGDPLTVIKKLLDILDKKFGSTINEKGFRVLHYVRLIQGDGVDERAIDNILGAMMVNGWSADNISFGMGASLLQKVDRDTQKFALKCSSAGVNGEWRDVYKDPITDQGKKSKAGRVQLFLSDSENEYYTSVNELSSEDKEILQTVYENGKLLIETDFQSIRKLSSDCGSI